MKVINKLQNETSWYLITMLENELPNEAQFENGCNCYSVMARGATHAARNAFRKLSDFLRNEHCEEENIKELRRNAVRAYKEAMAAHSLYWDEEQE